MSNVYVISDLHLGHKNITRYRTDFLSEEDHFNRIKSEWHKVIRKDDKVFVLGDVCFTKEALKDFATWIGSKVLIMGNHDTDREVGITDLVGVYKEIHSVYKYKNKAWLTHAPIHPNELRGKLNIHGHTHISRIADPRYINVCAEQTGYRPVNIQHLLQ